MVFARTHGLTVALGAGSGLGPTGVERRFRRAAIATPAIRRRWALAGPLPRDISRPRFRGDIARGPLAVPGPAASARAAALGYALTSNGRRGGCIGNSMFCRCFARTGSTTVAALAPSRGPACRLQVIDSGVQRSGIDGSIVSLTGTIGRVAKRLAAGLCTTPSTLALGQRRWVARLVRDCVFRRQRATATRLGARIASRVRSEPTATVGRRLTKRVSGSGRMLQPLRRAAFGIWRVRTSGRPGLCRKRSGVAT